MADTHDLLRQAELDGERVAALFRFVIFAAFLAMIVLVGGSVHGFDIMVWTAIYGLGTAAGLTLAWRGLFHPALRYLFVTFDVTVVAVQLLLFARALGVPPGLGSCKTPGGGRAAGNTARVATDTQPCLPWIAAFPVVDPVAGAGAPTLCRASRNLVV